MSALRFVLPMPENLANSRMHWRVKHNKRTDYFAKLTLMRAAGLLPKRPGTAPAKASVHARMVLGAQMDHDNAVARLKWPMDWLVTEGYIAGDKPSQLEWEGFPEQVVKRGGEYCIVLTITPK